MIIITISIIIIKVNVKKMTSSYDDGDDDANI